MNKLRDTLLSFFLAPVTAFFLPKVYRDAAKASWRKGARYIAYGALIFTVFIMAFFLERASTCDKFIRWVKNNAPVVIWTPGGLSLENGQKTLSLVHPDYGPVATFDMDREIVTAEDMGRRFLFITSKRIVFRKMLGELEDRDVTKTTLQKQSLPDRLRVTGDLIENFYWVGKLTFLAVTPLVFFPIALIVLLFINAAFTIAGLLLNEVRRQKLTFSAIFNLSCFSTGTSLIATGFTIAGFLFSQPFPTWLVPISLIVSLLYMIAAVIFVEKPITQSSQGHPNPL